jgi:hypothetical protein
MGLFGTLAPVLIDVNMLVQVVLLILVLLIAVLGFKQKQRRLLHGILAIIAMLTNLVTVFLIMGPSFAANWYLLTVVIVAIFVEPNALPYFTLEYLILAVHIIIGTITLLLAFLFAFNFLYAYTSKESLSCGSNLGMRILLIIWLISFLIGISYYITHYL